MAIKALKQNVSIREIHMIDSPMEKQGNKRSYCNQTTGPPFGNAGLYERKRYLSTLQFLLH